MNIRYKFSLFGCATITALQIRHNERDGVSNHQHHDCLLNRLSRRRSKETSMLASLAFVWGIHRWPVNSPHKGTVTRKIFPFHDVIMGKQDASAVTEIAKSQLSTSNH